ncbi:MAG: hypothetical protein IIA07_07470 [Proteobacteria bacterium]|nr:hypothetical protein [Pseudomonadota bacterium]
MFKESKTQKVDAECILHLVETCTGIIKKYGFPDNDARTTTLVNVRVVSYSSLGICNLLDSWSIGDDVVRQAIPQLLGLDKADNKSVRFMGDSLHKTSKLSLILLGQFQIENCIANICNAIGVESNTMGFYNKADALLSHCGFDQDELDILNTGAQIRNSLHSNGIHHGYRGGNFHSELKGVQYDFIDGQKVSCASFPHIAHALECSIEVLDEIFSARQVKAHTSLIPDAYAMTIGLGTDAEEK